MWPLMGELTKRICLCLLAQKSMKALGKKDYADIIKFGGWVLYIDTASKMYEVITEESIILKNTKKVGQTIWPFVSWLFTKHEEVDRGLGELKFDGIIIEGFKKSVKSLPMKGK